MVGGRKHTPPPTPPSSDPTNQSTTTSTSSTPPPLSQGGQTITEFINQIEGYLQPAAIAQVEPTFEKILSVVNNGHAAPDLIADAQNQLNNLPESDFYDNNPNYPPVTINGTTYEGQSAVNEIMTAMNYAFGSGPPTTPAI